MAPNHEYSGSKVSTREPPTHGGISHRVSYQNMSPTTSGDGLILAGTNHPKLRRNLSNSINRSFSPWIRKPLWVVSFHEDIHHEHSDEPIRSDFIESSSLDTDSSSTINNQLHRHLTLFDLVSVGVGGTIGSGIFVLCGLIANQYAGPATFLSWGIAGVAACLSGCCFAEMAGRIPTAGSSYAYTFISMGELPAFVSAGCLTLEYLFCGAAVARSWGDKVLEWLRMEGCLTVWSENGVMKSSWLLGVLEPGWGLNPMAALVSAVSTALLYYGVKESKSVTNFFSTLKVALVVFMTVGGMLLLDRANLTPLIPPKFGMAGVFRGATSSFFGYIGYDEVCCLAGEAINPRKNMPRAVMLVIAFVTVLYMAAAVALVGMQPYDTISTTSGFPEAFKYNQITWATHITAIGEVLTLPIVVLITLMAQPRLQFALAEDGLLPPLFGQVDGRGNLQKGTFVAGAAMTVIATCVPFTYINDLISAGILVAFTMTDASVLLLRRESPEVSPFLLEKLLVAFNISSFITALVINHLWEFYLARFTTFCLASITVGLVCTVAWKCPERQVFGEHGTVTTKIASGSSDGYFRTPWVPYFPCMGIFVNWYLVAQLEFSGLLLLMLYIGLCVAVYYAYGAKHSVANLRGWDSAIYTTLEQSGETSEQQSTKITEPNMSRSISLPCVDHNSRAIT